MTRSFIPQLLNQLENPNSLIKKWAWPIGIFTIFTGVTIGYLFRKKRLDLSKVQKRQKGDWDLATLQDHIIKEKLFTVERLAEYLDTNPVQLNRKFKKLGITPGKFLKKVKLKQAKIMLKEGQSIEEVAKYIGYSTKFLKDELDS